MDKVYCKNCKYGKGTIFCGYEPKYDYKEIGSEFCGSHKRKIIDRSDKIIYPAYKHELNKEGVCSHYEESKRRTWWKFWIKTNKVKKT